MGLDEPIAALSRFAADHTDAIDKIDLNPVIVHALIIKPPSQPIKPVSLYAAQFRPR